MTTPQELKERLDREFKERFPCLHETNFSIDFKYDTKPEYELPKGNTRVEKEVQGFNHTSILTVLEWLEGQVGEDDEEFWTITKSVRDFENQKITGINQERQRVINIIQSLKEVYKK